MIAAIFMPLYFFIGSERSTIFNSVPQIGGLQQESLAYQGGLREYDIISSVNGKQIEIWEDVFNEAGQSKKLSFAVFRGGDFVKINFTDVNITELGINAFQEPIVGRVFGNTPASIAGIQAGDKIISIGDSIVKEWQDISSSLQKVEAKPTDMIVQRSGQLIKLQVSATWEPAQRSWVIGVAAPTENISYGIVGSISNGWSRLWQTTTDTFYVLGGLFYGQTSFEEFGGPIMIAQVIQQTSQRGIAEFMALVAFISLQLAIFNLLPIPGLDGGHILIHLIESVKGRELSIEIKRRVQVTGLFLLLFFVIYITIQDSFRFFL